jgi:O-antigen ligase
MVAGLPGREHIVTALTVAGIPQHWAPFSLDSGATAEVLVAMMPPLAIFLAVLTANSRTRWLLAGVILMAAAANVMLGLGQRLQGPKSSLYLYEISNFGQATGFFSNRNNFAMLLCASIPLVWALTHKLMRGFGTAQRLLVLAGGGVGMGIVFVGLAVSGSRSGIFLGMLALALSTAMVWSPPGSSQGSARSRLSLLAILGAALIVGQFGMIGLLRIADTDPLAEYRLQISEVTLRAAADFAPFGSGFGTFPAVYAMYETPATMLSSYVNHAHNDWLELWLEGGVPAAVLLAVFLLLFIWQAVRVWNPKGSYASHVLPRAASVGALVLMIHSFVEFPLRMPALACVFAYLLAVILTPHFKVDSVGRKSVSRRRNEQLPTRPMPAKIAAPPVFRVPGKDGAEDRQFGK